MYQICIKRSRSKTWVAQTQQQKNKTYKIKKTPQATAEELGIEEFPVKRTKADEEK